MRRQTATPACRLTHRSKPTDRREQAYNRCEICAAIPIDAPQKAISCRYRSCFSGKIHHDSHASPHCTAPTPIAQSYAHLRFAVGTADALRQAQTITDCTAQRAIRCSSPLYSPYTGCAASCFRSAAAAFAAASCSFHSRFCFL